MRTKTQEYANIAAIVAEADIINEGNDMVYAEAEKGLFIWVQASTATADGVNVLQETRTVGAGRWHRQITVSAVLTGNANSTAIANGNSVTTDITVTGVLAASFNIVKVTNAATLNTAGLDIVSKEVVSNDTVRVVVYNSTGTNIAAQNIVVAVAQI